MRISVLVLLSHFAFSMTFGQVGHPISSRWFLDKPTLKQDSINLLNSDFSKIIIYNLYIDDSLGFRVTDTIIWTLSNSQGKITGVSSRPNSDLMTINSQKFIRGKIVEVIGGDCEKYRLTHHLDKLGQVIRIDNRCLNCECESRYFFDWAECKYEKGLIKEIIYFSDRRFVTKNLAYAKYIFEYRK